jgi:membrane protease YdiL (CAAX protease family)
MLGCSIALSLLLGYRSVGSLPVSVHGSVMNLLLKMALTTVIAMPFAFGEEFAWRGYAQDKLIRQFGLSRGLFLLGLLWGLWHSPLYYLMNAFPNHPLLGSFVMTPIDNILVVVPMAWFYIRSKSIWVPTFLHALGDILWGYSDKLFPIHSEIGAWAMLQGVQLVLSILLLRALMTGQRHAKPLLVGDTPNQSMTQSGSAQNPAVAYLFRDF